MIACKIYMEWYSMFCNGSQLHGSANLEFFNAGIDSPLFFAKNRRLMKLLI
jgi:hypothetical protein